VELVELDGARVVRVGEEDHVVGPLTNEECVLDRAGDGAEHAERLVADLPAVQ